MRLAARLEVRQGSSEGRTRHELADMMRDMVAELRSSHVSVYTGDAGEHRRRRAHSPGHLGADFAWDPSVCGYVVTKIVEGDVWDEHTGGALRKPGVNVAVGDVLTHVNRVRLSAEVGPSARWSARGSRGSPDVHRGRWTAAAARRVHGVWRRRGPRAEDRGGLPRRLDESGKGKTAARENRRQREKRQGQSVRPPPPPPPPPKHKGLAKPADAARKPGARFDVRVRAMHSELDARLTRHDQRQDQTRRHPRER